jgi:ribonucleoside-diphosphate reductase alpha chain
MTSLSVTKRNGVIEAFCRDEIKNDIAFFLTENIKLEEILDELQNGLVDKISTVQISELLANISASKISRHPDHNKLAAAICVMKLHKETDSSYIDTMTKLFRNDPQLISEKAYNTALKFADRLESAIDYNRDFLIDFFGLKTLERSYLKKIHTKTLENYSFEEIKSKRPEPLGHNNEELKYVHTSTIIERPQHLWMTVSLGIHGEDIERVLECYDYMSRLVFVSASPTLFNASTNREQLSSCFILGVQDNIENIFKTVGDMAKISKYAGGIGVTLSRIRAKNSIIRGTNGTSDGVVPLCVMLNKLARYINQGGLRNGSIACYMEPHHADIFDFVELRKNTGDENNRARDLFLGLWVNDIFMKRVEADEMWSLMCPDECPGLVDTYGDEFESLYTKYESEGKYKRRVKAKDLWYHILDAQCETGMPYMCYKDHVNKKTNHQNVGVINSSNLCVAPETKILTEDGIYKIKDLNDKEVKVWNGEKWSQTKVVKTGENQKLLKITLSNGAILETTPYHKFIIRESYTDKKALIKATRVEAKDLKVGMKLAKSEQVIIKGDVKNDIKYSYTHGFFCGDGTYTVSKYAARPILSLYGEKKDLLPYLEIRSTSGVPDASGRLNTSLPHDLDEKFFVPMNASLECRLRWLEGLFDADGCVCRNGTNQSLQLCSIENDFLQNIRLMLSGMGVNAKVTKLFLERQTLLPDGKGGKKMFDCKPSWRVLISSSGLKTLYDMGFRPKRLKIEDHDPQRNAEQFTQVVSVEDNGRSDDTYCFNEPENHAGVFNGVLTGNCSEIMEHYNENEYAVCNLSSICLPKFVRFDENNKPYFDFNELLKVSKIVTRNLDRVIDVNFYPVIETKNF